MLREVARRALWHMPNLSGELQDLARHFFIENLASRVHVIAIRQKDRERRAEIPRVPRGSKSWSTNEQTPIGRDEGARENRQRLAALERPAILAEIDKKAADVPMNMARLRELRLAKEAQEVRTEISTGKPASKAKTEKAIQIGRQPGGGLFRLVAPP
jgi:hypothetical protein